MVDEAQEWRESLLELAAEANEELMEKYLEEGDLSEEDFNTGLRIRTLAGEIQPMLCGTAFKNKGVRSEEHTSELQSRGHLVCRLLLEKKKKTRMSKERSLINIIIIIY